MKLIHSIHFFLYTAIMVLSISSCEDPVPNDYQQQTVVEALLIVNKPIQNIHITHTQPLSEAYSYYNAIINNAKVYIVEVESGREFELSFRYADTAGNSGYYLHDTTYLVKKQTKYQLKVILPDGETVTGETTTPDSIAWNKQIIKYLPYPDDTLNLPEDTAARTEWTINPNNKNAMYIYNIICLDTLKYGKYLETPIDELNRRIKENRNNNNNPLNKETSISSFTLINKMPFNWRMVRWFGHHSIKIYVPDANYERWFQYLLMSASLNDKAFSVKGCAGYFGSAFAIEDEFVLLKNNPTTHK